MNYRIQIFRAEARLLDLACNRSLSEAREEAVAAIDMLNGDYALILDNYGRQLDRLKRSR